MKLRKFTFTEPPLNLFKGLLTFTKLYKKLVFIND